MKIRVTYKPGRPIPEPYSYYDPRAAERPGDPYEIFLHDGTVVALYSTNLLKKKAAKKKSTARRAKTKSAAKKGSRKGRRT